MGMLGKVRRLFHRRQLSVSEIARQTGLSRNTIKKWLGAAGEEMPKYRRESQPEKLAPFEVAIRQALGADARRPKRDRRTVKRLLAEIQAQGYAGGYTVLKDFIRNHREEAGANAPAGRSSSKPIRARVMRCCSMPIRRASERWVASLGAASMTI